MRLIDKDAVLKLCSKSGEGVVSYEEVEEKLPEIDAEIVTRCSECRHCYNEDCETPYDGGAWWYCARWDKGTNAYGTDPYRFYCADGERREDNDKT